VVSTRLARYPFLEEARQEVSKRADTLLDVVSEPVLERAEERVTNSIRESGTGGIADSPRVELFSYPVARAVVSVLDEHPVTRRYSWAESVTAHERMVKDANTDSSFGSVGDTRLELEGVVDEFDLNLNESKPKNKDQGGYTVEVGDYLSLASGMSDEEWKLINRSVEDGWVRLTRDDVLELSREAVRQRVAEGLPLDVPEEAREAVTDAVEKVQRVVDETEMATEIDRVEKQEFPPCMKTLLKEIREGEHLEHHSRFAITAFLTNIGMTTDEIVDTYEVNPGFGEEITRYQTDHIRGETGPTDYSCPSCATMVTYGDCRNRDELCETISHPLGYYRKKLEALEDKENEDRDENGRKEKDGGNGDTEAQRE